MDDELKVLHKSTEYPDEYAPQVLESFVNVNEFDMIVRLNCPEFSSICPKTGQPDFGKLYITYIPDKLMVESKSLKLYLFSFRNHGAFHERCVHMIGQDLMNLLKPNYLEVVGKFLPRGGISIDPIFVMALEEYEGFAQERMMRYVTDIPDIDNR